MLEELKKIYRIIVSFPPDLEDNEDELTTEVPSDTSTQDPPLWGGSFCSLLRPRRLKHLASSSIQLRGG